MPKPDGNMMLEMQLKMAKRAERAAAGSDGAAAGSNEDRQQQWLANKMAAAPTAGADGVGAALASDAASGALWAKRRQSQQLTGGVAGLTLGETSQSLMSPSAMKAAQAPP